jgi:hypothetical protein
LNVALASALIVAPPSALACAPKPLRVFLYPSPFRKSMRREIVVPSGDSLACVIADALDLYSNLSVPVPVWYKGWTAAVNGHEIPEHMWTRYVPPPGATVTLVMVPQIFEILGAIFALGAKIGFLITLALGFSLEAAALGALIGGFVLTGLAVAAIGYAAFAAYKSLASPQTSGRMGAMAGAGGGGSFSSGSGRARSDSPTINGQGNAVTPWQPIWRVYGRHRIQPVIVGKPYTEIDGGTVYLRMLLCPGYGPLKISDMRLGTTPLEEIRGTEVEVIEGWKGQKAPSLYPGAAVQEAYQIRLNSNDGGPTGEAKVRTTALKTTEVRGEIVFPGGFTVFRDSQPGDESVDDLELDREMKFRVRYRKAGTTDWSQPSQNASDEKFRINVKQGIANLTGSGGTFSVKSRNQGRFYVGFRFFPGREDEVAVADQWDVEVHVVNHVRKEGGPLSAECYWQAMVSMIDEPSVKLGGLCLIGLRVKASNQLQGAIETFNCLAESYLRRWSPPVGIVGGWSGTADPTINERNNGWYTVVGTNEVGRSPAWAYADIMTGRAQRDPLGDDLLDIQRIYEWSEGCKDFGLKCDAVIDFGGTTHQAARDIAATGWASPHMRDGKVSVVFERDTEGEAPAAVMNPRNVLRRTFKGMKSFEPLPHAFRVRFLDADRDFEFGERLVFDDGFDESNATEYAEMELWGVTNADLAWQFGRRRLAELKLRPELFQIEQDVESFRIERGDKVALSHDVPLLGIAYGVIATVNPEPLDEDDETPVTSVTLDEVCTYEPGKEYGATIRNPSSPFDILTVEVNNQAGAEIVKSKTVAFAVPVARESVQLKALVSFGERGLEHRPCIIKEIERLDDLNARLILVDEAPGIWDAVNGTIPPYDPGISLPLNASPRTPEIVEARIEQGVIVLVVRPGEGGGVPPRWFEVNFRSTDPGGVAPDGEWTKLQLFEVDGVEEIDVGPVAENHYYDIRVRAIGGPLNAFSGWDELPDFFYTGPTVTARAFRVTNLELKGQGSDRRFEGREAELEWGLNSPEYTENVLTEPNSIPPGQSDIDARNPFFLDYEVRVVDPRDPLSTPDRPVRTDHVFARGWRYGIEAQRADMRGRAAPFNTSPMRKLLVGVAFRDRRKGVGLFTWIEVENPPPTIGRVTFGTSQATVWATALDVRDNDLRRYLLWAERKHDFPLADFPLDSEIGPGKTLRVRSDSNQMVWNDATKGEWWIYVAAEDEFGPEDLEVSGPYVVNVAGPGARKDILIGDSEIVASGSDWVRLAGSPFSVTEGEAITCEVEIVAEEDTIPTPATGQARVPAAFDPTTGRFDFVKPWRAIPTPGVDLARLTRNDADDGVVSEFKIGHATINRLTLINGAVSSGSRAQRMGFSEKPRRNRYRTLAASSIDLAGDEIVELRGYCKVDEPTSDAAFNQLIFLREMARGVVVAPGYVSLDRAESLTKWSSELHPDGILSLVGPPDAQEGDNAVELKLPVQSGTIFLLLDVASQSINLSDTTLRWRWRGMSSLVALYTVTDARLYALKTAGDIGIYRSWNIASAPHDWTQASQNLAAAPDDSLGAWDEKNVAQIMFRLTVTGLTGATFVRMLVDQVEINRAGNNATRLIGDAVLEPGAYESTGLDIDAGEKTFVVALRPLRRSDPEDAPGVWDFGGVMEENPATTAQELYRVILSNDVTSIEVGNPPGSAGDAFPNDDFTNGEPQVDDEYIVFEVLADFLQQTTEAELIQVSHDDFAPPGSQNPNDRKPTEYRLAVRRFKEPGGGVVDQPYTLGRIVVREFGR